MRQWFKEMRKKSCTSSEFLFPNKVRLLPYLDKILVSTDNISLYLKNIPEKYHPYVHFINSQDQFIEETEIHYLDQMKNQMNNVNKIISETFDRTYDLDVVNNFYRFSKGLKFINHYVHYVKESEEIINTELLVKLLDQYEINFVDEHTSETEKNKLQIIRDKMDLTDRLDGMIEDFESLQFVQKLLNYRHEMIKI